MGEKCERWDLPVGMTFSGDIVRKLSECAIFFVVFDYREAMFETMLECTLQSDWPIIRILYCSYPLHVTINKGNLTVRNYETEDKEGDAERQEVHPGRHQNTH